VPAVASPYQSVDKATVELEDDVVAVRSEGLEVTPVVQEGRAQQVLVDMSHEADLVVVGVASGAACPVAVVPSGAAAPPGTL